MVKTSNRVKWCPRIWRVMNSNATNTAPSHVPVRFMESNFKLYPFRSEGIHTRTSTVEITSRHTSGSTV